MMSLFRSTAIAACMGIAALPVAAQTFDCVITPALTVNLSAPVGGLLSEVTVGRGDLVEKGQVIARLDTSIEQTTVDLMKERAASQSDVEVQRARLALAESRMERVATLVERNITSKEELEEAKASVDVAGGELAMAEMRNRIATLELKRANEIVNQRTITSPIDGVVQSRSLFTGEYTDQDAEIVTIAQLDPLHVEAFLPVEMFTKLTVGMAVEITPRAPLEGTFQGHIKVIDRIFDAASGTFGVQVVMPNPDLALPAGHRCEVRFPNQG